MAKPVRVARYRHARHDDFGRVRRRRSFLSWLGQQATRLAASATGVNFTVTIDQATGVLTLTGNAVADETVTIGARVYTFVASLTAADQVLIGASASDTLDNLIAAINNAAGEGSTYGSGTAVHADVTAAAGAGDTMDVTAILGGDITDIATTDTMTNGSWGAAALAGGGVGSLGATAHGISDREGPYRVTSSGDIPGGLAADTDYWVIRVDANTFRLAPTPDGAAVTVNSVGSGTITVTKAVDSRGIHGLLFRNKPRTIQAASDIDTLA